MSYKQARLEAWWDKEVDALCATFGYNGLVRLLTGKEKTHPNLFAALRRNAPELAAKYPTGNENECYFFENTIKRRFVE